MLQRGRLQGGSTHAPITGYEFPEENRRRIPNASSTINSIRLQDRKYAQRKDIFAEIMNELAKKGRFLTDGTRAFYRPKCLGIPIHLDRETRLCELMLSSFGLTPGEEVSRFVLKELELHAFQNGDRVKLRAFSYYDDGTNRLYVDNHAGGMYRVSADEIMQLTNGADGVLFEPRLNDADDQILFIDDPECVEEFEKAFPGTIVFAEVDSALSPSNQARLFNAWLLSMFFKEIMPTNPLLLLVGEKGSGKSATLRMFGRLLYGNDFEVTEMSEKQEDFDTAVTNCEFIVLDNADTKKAWLEDRLASAATGGRITKRKLYATNTSQSFRVTARIGMTARTPSFRRDDVADRLIVLRLNRLSKFIPECELSEAFMVSRDRMYSGLLMQLQGVVQALESTRGHRYRGKLRLADFGAFCQRIAIGRGEEREMDEALEQLLAQQEEFCIEENSLLDVLMKWAEIPGNNGRRIETMELFTELEKLCRDECIPFNRVAPSLISLGRQLGILAGNGSGPVAILKHTGFARHKIWEVSLRVEPMRVRLVSSDNVCPGIRQGELRIDASGDRV